jgi:hypothetical protein
MGLSMSKQHDVRPSTIGRAKAAIKQVPNELARLTERKLDRPQASIQSLKMFLVIVLLS